MLEGAKANGNQFLRVPKRKISQNSRERENSKSVEEVGELTGSNSRLQPSGNSLNESSISTRSSTDNPLSPSSSPLEAVNDPAELLLVLPNAGPPCVTSADEPGAAK